MSAATRLMAAAKPALSYSLEEAALATGHSLSTIKRACKAGDLTKRYYNSTPVIHYDELKAWVDSFGYEAPKGRAS